MDIKKLKKVYSTYVAVKKKKNGSLAAAKKIDYVTDDKTTILIENK